MQRLVRFIIIICSSILAAIIFSDQAIFNSQKWIDKFPPKFSALILLKISFHLRSQVKTETGSRKYWYANFSTLAMSSGESQRKNGFVSFSSNSVDGREGKLLLRSSDTRVLRSWIFGLPGSTISAKPRLSNVYSCPQ